MDDKVYIALQLLYKAYNEEFKPLVALVETTRGKFPGPILNELRAMNDHVSRVFRDGVTVESAEKEIGKANGHLMRATLDCFKVLILAYESSVNTLYEEYKDVNLAVVRDGKFIPTLEELRGKAKSLAIKAKNVESESFPEKEKSYLAYKEAVVAYEKVQKYIEDSWGALANASLVARNMSKEEKRERRKNNWKYAIIGALVSIVLSEIYTWIKAIFIMISSTPQ